MAERIVEEAPEQPAPVFDKRSMVPLVQAVRQVTNTWNDKQLREGGVAVILFDNNGFMSISSSPGVDIISVLKSALETEVSGDYTALAITAQGEVKPATDPQKEN